jgi:hypothetical protein
LRVGRIQAAHGAHALAIAHNNPTLRPQSIVGTNPGG